MASNNKLKMSSSEWKCHSLKNKHRCSHSDASGSLKTARSRLTDVGILNVNNNRTVNTSNSSANNYDYKSSSSTRCSKLNGQSKNNPIELDNKPEKRRPSQKSLAKSHCTKSDQSSSRGYNDELKPKSTDEENVDDNEEEDEEEDDDDPESVNTASAKSFDSKKNSTLAEEIPIPENYQEMLKQNTINELKRKLGKNKTHSRNSELSEKQFNRNDTSRTTTNNSQSYSVPPSDQKNANHSLKNKKTNSFQNFNFQNSSPLTSFDKNFSRLSQHSNSQSNYVLNDNMNTNSLSHFSRLNSCGNSPRRSKLSSTAPMSQLNSIYSHLGGRKEIHRKDSEDMCKFQNLNQFCTKIQKSYSLQNNRSPMDENSNFNRIDDDEEGDDDGGNKNEKSDKNETVDDSEEAENDDDILAEFNLTKSQLIDIQFSLLKDLLKTQEGNEAKNVNVKDYIKSALKEQIQNRANALNDKFMSSEPALAMELNSDFSSNPNTWLGINCDQSFYQTHSKNHNNQLEAERCVNKTRQQKRQKDSSGKDSKTATNTSNNSKNVEKNNVRDWLMDGWPSIPPRTYQNFTL